MFPNKHWLILFACFRELQIKLHHDRIKRRHLKHNDGLCSISLYPSQVSGLGSQSGGQPGGAGVQGCPRRTTHYESSGEQIIPDPVVPLPSPLKKPIRVSLTQCACSLHRLPLLQKKQRLYWRLERITDTTHCKLMLFSAWHRELGTKPQVTFLPDANCTFSFKTCSQHQKSSIFIDKVVHSKIRHS